MDCQRPLAPPELKFRLGAFFSCVLHLIFLLLLLWFSLPTPQDKKEQQKQEDPTAGVVFLDTNPTNSSDELQKEKEHDIAISSSGDTECSSSYDGIGVTTNFGTSLIDKISPGSPAAKAGLTPSDEILNTDKLGPNMYEEGTTVPVIVRHSNGKVETLMLTIAKVCYQP